MIEPPQKNIFGGFIFLEKGYNILRKCERRSEGIYESKGSIKKEEI
ncbi:hypothetical protein Calkro_1702 [Caldicellulosiruptor kronotskyensis 2002]|uniref:Uncharacterized protein n=1 Tax=Caldicellulosiruptor kronotskyensis (strain DSM 18902 / VKM B-2412 / 2002) TaxID=632348 RepID=E4SFM9_CALK2|nr:hypothetical protein Calkro_1702 [Caldicellulosiruptor kronotskyensis 2002]SLL37789.1 hypothetical protein SAMN05216181_0251 [Caldicellulosiruptor bescii]